MTVQELIEALQKVPNKNLDVVIKYGCLIVGEKILIDNADDMR